MNHGSIVQLVAHIEDTDNHYVLTEYCSQGELTKLAMENLSEAQIAKIAFQVAHGLEYLHSQGIAHCDLKLSNLLMQNGQIVLMIGCRKYAILASVAESTRQLREMFVGLSYTWPLKLSKIKRESITNKLIYGP